MPGKNEGNTAPKDSGNETDSEARLQEELNRESSEGADSIGDIASNRTLSGSSTWETLPDEPPSSRRASTPKDQTPNPQ